MSFKYKIGDFIFVSSRATDNYKRTARRGIIVKRTAWNPENLYRVLFSDGTYCYAVDEKHIIN